MNRPLDGIRVLELSDGRTELCGRYLVELGADVTLVEPTGGSPSRQRGPFQHGVSCHFLTRNLGKQSVVMDLHSPAGVHQFLSRLSEVDILIESQPAGFLAERGIAPAALLERLPSLVIVSITDFGQTGPRRDWRGTERLHQAMTGVLSRSGALNRPPLMPPGELAYASAAVQAVWCALLALRNRDATGIGDHLDVSVSEALAQVLDPPLGAVGSAAASAGGKVDDRSSFQPYPIIPCADGHVRLVVLAVRQWRALRAWLGDPEDLLDPQFDRPENRFAHAELIEDRLSSLFKDLAAIDLVLEGQRRGIPIAPVLTPAQVTRSPHFRERGAFIEVELPDGGHLKAPSGFIELDGRRLASPVPFAPDPGQQRTDDVLATRSEAMTGSPARRERRRPLAGIRVLDMGVIVMGAEAGRLLADQGADVIKIENRAYPDGSRATLHRPMTRQFAAAQRGKRSLGIDLRHGRGRDFFLRLVAESDVLLSNFKPGTLESLNLGADVIREINPRLIMASTSAMGSRGPWSDWMGYGPLVRCVSGLTSLWRYEDDPGAFGDASTIFPDHFAARVVDAAVVAALHARAKTSLGAHIEASQAEIVLNALPEMYSGAESEPVGGPFLSGIFECAGLDDWCVVDIHDAEEQANLAALVGSAVAETEKLTGALEAWTRGRTSREVQDRLQDNGIPAAAMSHVRDLPRNEHLQERRFFRSAMHPLLSRPVTMENGPCLSLGLSDPELLPASLHGQHTREIARDLLGLTDSEVDQLIGAGVLQENDVPADAVIL